MATGLRRGWKQTLLSSSRKRNSSVVLLGAAGAATASALVNGREHLPFAAISVHCSSNENARMDEQVELYVDAILGSKMSNIPGLPGFYPFFFNMHDTYRLFYMDNT